MPTFPASQLPLLLDLGTRLIGSRKPKTELEPLARGLLDGFVDICMQLGQDVLLRDDLVDATVPTLVAEIKKVDIDGGGPRNAKPRQLTDALLASLGITLADEPAGTTITLDGGLRAAVAAALATVVDRELALPAMRDRIIADARKTVEEQHFPAFEKLSAELDERGMRIMRQPKLALDAVQAVQRALTKARTAFFDRVGRSAIDRAKEVLGTANPEAADRIDQPVTARLTPRDVAILRATDSGVPKHPGPVVEALLAGLSLAARIVWLAAEKVARPYGASQTYAIGDVIEHPKFGRGTVVSMMMKRIDVEFPTGKVTLIHVPPRT